MARRVFFSFHFHEDCFRANQVRNSNVVMGTDVAGFFDHSEYTEAKTKGHMAIQKMIQRHLEYTSVTVVLVGTYTAGRPWVNYEIEESLKRKNGLLGIYINHLKNGGPYGTGSPPGMLPKVPPGIEFPSYMWDGDVLRFAAAIEAAGLRSDALKKKGLTIATGFRF